MTNSNRTIFDSPDDGNRFIGRRAMEKFVPIPSTAGPNHLFGEAWGACPDYAATPTVAAQLTDDLAAVVEENALIEPTVVQIQEALEYRDLLYLREAWLLQRRNFRYYKELSKTDADVDLAALQEQLREKIYDLLDSFAEWAAAKGGHWRGWFAKLSDGQGDVEFNKQDDVEADQIVSDWIEQRDREENYHCPEQIQEAKEAQAEQGQAEKEEYEDGWYEPGEEAIWEALRDHDQVIAKYGAYVANEIKKELDGISYCAWRFGETFGHISAVWLEKTVSRAQAEEILGIQAPPQLEEIAAWLRERERMELENIGQEWTEVDRAEQKELEQMPVAASCPSGHEEDDYFANLATRWD